MSKFITTRFIVPTSNAYERLFFSAGFANGDRRKGILPANFEIHIFLHVNSALWSLEDVNKIGL